LASYEYGRPRTSRCRDGRIRGSVRVLPRICKAVRDVAASGTGAVRYRWDPVAARNVKKSTREKCSELR
jgi:hypothetical protein